MASNQYSVSDNSDYPAQNQGDVKQQVLGRSRVIVKFKPNVTPSQIEKIKSELGVTKSQAVRSTGAQIWDLPTIAAVDSAMSIHGNGSNPVFEYIERDSVVRLSAPVFQKPDPVTSPGVKPAAIPNDPSFSQLWGLNNTGQNGGTVDADIDAPEAWNIETGNPNLVIGVIDTGVDYNHPDLVGNIWSNPGETIDGLDNDNNGYIDDTKGWDFAYGDNNPMDVQGHGTHVSGTIAGRGNNGVGVAGVTWNAKIMPLKFLNDSGSGFTSDAILAVDYATNKGVKITNNSWGGGGYSQGLYDAINAAGQAGSLFIAAAGNYANNADISPMYPAAYDLANIISVASTTRTDGLSSFSNYGLTSVDLGAPGSDIYSTTPNNSYATYSGTSMASPHVAGAAALLWSEYPGRTAQQIKNTLMQSGDSIAALAGRTVSGKRLNIYNALGSGTLPGVSVAVSPATVQEDGATNLVYTFTRSNLGLSSPLTVNFGASGTANATLIGSDPADYSVLTNSSVTFNPATRTGTVTFAAGATTAQVGVDPIADTRPEVANETVALVVNSGTGYIGETPGSATGTIVSEEALPIFTNPAPINIPSYGSGTPYPSTITVAGQTGNLSGLKVTLTGINHTWPDDIDVLLVGPNGAKTILMSDVGSFNDISNVTLTFDAAASSSLPDSGQLVSGAYKPTDFESGDLFASPAPPGPYSTNFSGFYNASPNGTWSLYVTDDVGGDAGSFAGGWSIELQAGPALPLVTVAATDASAAETLTGTTPNPGRFTLTRTGATTSALTVNVAMSGTATNSTDYTSIPATATFAVGSATALVNMNVIDDALVEGPESAILTVATGTGYLVGSTSAATVSIADNEPVVTIAATDASAAETLTGTTPNPGRFTLNRTGALTNALTVNLQRFGTATNGTDYTSIPATATFAAGSATALVNMNVIDDALVEGPESAILTVATGTGYLVGADSAATVTIVDNDGATPAPVVTIAATDPLAGETAVGVTPNPGRFTLTRTGATTSALTVNLVHSGTATNGTDYTSIPLTATFAAGSSTALVGVSVIDDTLIEGPETATLTVTTYGVGVYSVGAASTATVTILDNDVLLGRGSALPVNNGVPSLSNLSYGLTA